MIFPLTPDHITVDDISSLFNEEITVQVLRLDQLHPVISGNKWFKLRYYLEEANAQQKKTIVTMGGAWSNHILATAAACQLQGLKAIGIIRGEEPPVYSSTLLQVTKLGMQLVFISREDYTNRQLPPALSANENYFIPEGGFGPTGAKGASTILDHCSKDYTHYCCAVGTGTMMAGLINAVAASQQVIGISALKSTTDLDTSISSLVTTEDDNWQLLHDHHFGGYAKKRPELLAFMNEFYRQTNIPSDFVYTGKLFYAVSCLIRENFFPAGSKLLLIHSGGLQGNTSLGKGTLIF